MLIWLNWMRGLRRLSILRTAGIVKVSVPEYFTALKTQDLAYDFNKDGYVTGEDYSLSLEEIDKDL